ncbi:hypothetical protein MMC24_007383 [Lignoscripta atroalba]|nr:hypothetical protein [Lignoscripta atroalba]
MSRPNLRLIHSRDSADDLLFRANALLARGEAEKALGLYTRVLYETCPGHVCGFLNRSLAYVALGYPELAVADAYRAAVASYDMRLIEQCTSVEERRATAIVRYLRAEKLHKQSAEPWTSAPDCYVGQGWMSLHLASLMIEPEVNNKKTEVNCDSLELQALFRMCGALWQCGGGAVSDALGLIEDAMKKFTMTVDERYCFTLLGDCILEDVQGILEEAATRSPGSSEHNITVPGRDFGLRKARFRSLMAAKVTLVSREIYPWNSHEPDMRLFKNVEDLEIYADDVAKSCTIRSGLATPDQSAMFRLMAAKDIYPDETVLSESSILQVTTASPADIKGCYCDACAAVMMTPDEVRARVLANRPKNWSSGASAGSADSYPAYKLTSNSCDEQAAKDEPFFSQSTDDYTTARRTRTTSPKAPDPSPDAKSDLTPDVHYCNSCSEVPFCSTNCFAKSGDYHPILCGTVTEQDIRSSYIGQELAFEGHNLSKLVDKDLFIHPKAHCLYDLLLVRILVLAADKDIHPLDLNEVRYLNGDLRSTAATDASTYFKWLRAVNTTDPALYPSSPSPPVPRKSKTLPWSFQNNIVRPIHYLKEIGLDPVTQLQRCDAWVINTLIAKIMYSTRITKGVRHVRQYDEEGKLIAALDLALDEVLGKGKGREREKGNRKRKGNGNGENDGVWVGTLHTIFSMVGVADPDKGEVPNVSVSEHGVVRCFPIVPVHGTHSTDDAKNGDMDVDMDIDMDTQPLEEEDDGKDARSAAQQMRSRDPLHKSESEPAPPKPSIKAGDFILRAKDPGTPHSMTRAQEEKDYRPGSQESIKSWIGGLSQEAPGKGGEVALDLGVELRVGDVVGLEGEGEGRGEGKGKVERKAEETDDGNKEGEDKEMLEEAQGDMEMGMRMDLDL